MPRERLKNMKDKYKLPDDLFDADLASECPDKVCDKSIQTLRNRVTIEDLTT